MFAKSSMLLLNSTSCSTTDLCSTIRKKYNCCFKHCFCAKDLVIYNESSFDHIVAAEVSRATSLNTLSPRHKIIELNAFSSISVFSAFESVADICVTPFNASTHLL
ncbi:hypothetical protein QL285_053742 [Trifolium repens]|nr:hypothetical protein QL285_053742 [Trifolium repens]